MVTLNSGFSKISLLEEPDLSFEDLESDSDENDIEVLHQVETYSLKDKLSYMSVENKQVKESILKIEKNNKQLEQRIFNLELSLEKLEIV